MGPLHRRYPTHLRVKAAVSLKSRELNEHHGLIVTPVHINPLCLQLKDQDQPEGSSPFETDIRVNKGTSLVLSSRMINCDSQKAGSWQDMFLTQPPVQYVTLEVGPENDFDTLQLLVNRLSMRRERRSRAGICKVFVKEGVRFRHVVLEARKVLSGGLSRMSDHIIVMHGAIAATDEDEAVVKSRTKEWLNSQAYDI